VWAGIAAIAVVVVALAALGEDDDRRTERGAAGGIMAVELEGFDGQRLTLERYRGRPLVVNFFASWCGPCAREMPDFARVHRDLGDEVTFLGVNLQDNPQAALALVERSGVAYDLGRDDGALFAALGGVAIPTTAFITAEGAVVEVHGGELSGRALEAAVRRLLLA
jgi:thiol-disulfide isomerase/thioredoxin